MDDIVKAALKKWPNVPDCYDWLALDARGDWYMRDDRIQHAGPFPQVKGSLINHDKLKAFIQRNYACDDRGCWFFQNGPQRVYVTLEATPHVFGIRLNHAGTYDIASHTDQAVSQVKAVFTDELGRLFFDTDIGVGIVRSPDMVVASDAIDALAWDVNERQFSTLPTEFAYVLRPQP